MCNCIEVWAVFFHPSLFSLLLSPTFRKNNHSFFCRSFLGMETYSLVGVGAEIKFQVKFLPQYDCLIHSSQKHLRSTAVRAQTCSGKALAGSSGTFAFWELLQFCIFSLGCHALLLGADCCGHGDAGCTAIGRAGWLPGVLVSWFDRLSHASSILWSFLFSPVLEIPLLDGENLKLSAKQGYKGWLRHSLYWVHYNKDFLLSQYCGEGMKWPVIFILLLPGYVLSKNGKLWQFKSFLSGLSTFVLKQAPSVMQKQSYLSARLAFCRHHGMLPAHLAENGTCFWKQTGVSGEACWYASWLFLQAD